MRFKLITTFGAILTIASLSSCHTTVSLDYKTDPARGVAGSPVAAAGVFNDQRGMEATFIGTVGVPGVSQLTPVPMENIYLSVPVSDAVHNAVGHALSARKMLSTKPRFQITGDVVDLHCELIKAPYAIAVLRINVIDTHTNRVIHTQEARAERRSVFYVAGINDPTPIMRELTSRALQDAIDQALDNRELRRAIDSRQ